jgi:predicted TPR repeat methyltransferase
VKLRQGDIPGAVSALERAVELGTEDPVVNAHLGDAYWAAGRHLEAEYQWRRALNLHPEPEEQARLEKRLDEAEAPSGHNASAQVEGRVSQQN